MTVEAGKKAEGPGLVAADMTVNKASRRFGWEVSHKTIRFSQRQVRELRQGGMRVLGLKVRALANLAAFWGAEALALVLVLLIRAVRPLLLVRFGGLAAGRIGHYVQDTELYLCERDADIRRGRTIDLFYHGAPVCNYQIKKMWDRTLVTSPYLALLEKANRRMPGGEKHVVPMLPYDKYDQDMPRHMGNTSSHLLFTPAEEGAGRRALRELGVVPEAPFVCFHARDSGYLDSTLGDKDWRYHDYRDSSIHNYVPAAEELTRLSYFAIRVGATVKEPINATNPMVIDYATKFRTDFLDVYLNAKCCFFLGAHTGLAMAAAAFRRPLALVNVIPLEMAPTWGKYDLFIPKKLWLRQERRFMTFREVFDSGVAAFHSTQRYEEMGIKPVENTPEEITALAVEMHERLEGTWQTTEEDRELQARFWSVFKARKNHGPVVSHIGAQFLRQHQELLD